MFLHSENDIKIKLILVVIAFPYIVDRTGLTKMAD